MTSIPPPSALSVLVAHGVMMRGSADGSIGHTDAPAQGTEGLYVEDTRLLSRWLLEIGASDFWNVGSVHNTGRRTAALTPAARRNQTHDIFAVRSQELGVAGLTEALNIRNLAREETTVRLVLRVGTDFADQFTVRTDGRCFDLSAAVSSSEVTDDGSLVLNYSHNYKDRSFEAGVRVSASLPPEIRLDTPAGRFVGAVLTWNLPIPAGKSRTLTVTAAKTGAAARALPAVVTDVDHGLSPLGRQSRQDLDSLLMPCPLESGLTIPAAGLPWFLTLFGRDSLLTSMLTRKERPALLRDVLKALAATQGAVNDPVRVEQPGKIVHEIRVSELAQLGAVPYSRYYGTVDSTALFLMALGQEDDPELLRELEPSARAAVKWICGDGGLKRTGFVRYTPDAGGLLHQGWKDSFDAVAGADGRQPAGAIALAEVQGYTWRGLNECARLASGLWDDDAWAHTLRQLADDLRARFREMFWMKQHNFPALALDGDNRQVDALASNAGHLLWTGILNEDEARTVTSRLMQEDFFTGWGIRTLAVGQHYYHPMSYHNGSVWPHDTMLAAEGMAAYGFTSEARTIASGMQDAAAHFGNTLPELFGGFSRTDFPVPVMYHHAGSPQAWAAAAGISADRLA